MSSRFLPIAPLAGALLLALCAPAYAQVAGDAAATSTKDSSAADASPEAGSKSEGITRLPKVLVEGQRRSIAPVRDLEAQALQSGNPAAADTARLLEAVPGLWVNPAGGVSSLPAIHGLADDRLRIRVDGADITASCPNHMNPPLSYLAPAQVARITVYPGVTPVSQGGDSIGGSIVVERAAPAFAAPGAGWQLDGRAGVYARSNGNARGADLDLHLASDRFSLRYTGSTARADNYRAGGDFKTFDATGRSGHTLPRDEVGASGYVVHQQHLDLAYAMGDHLLEARLGWQQIPHQDYPNQRMDMTDNRQRSVNLRYLGQFGWGRLEARAYRELLDHAMDFGPDKRYWYGASSGTGSPCAPVSMTCAAGMPMLTRSDTSAFNLDADLDLAEADHLRLGAELRRYRLDDTWPPSGGMMGPGTFYNVVDGQRDRAAAYAEWEHRLAPAWTLEAGVRREQVRRNAGPVRGYDPTSNMMGAWQMRDAAAFNAADRRRSDGLWDASVILRQQAGAHLDIAYGLARKTRAPGLYEVYPWSTWAMAAIMNNFVGDGNGYIGNLALRPERATTASVTFDLHDPAGAWQLRATPYVTRVSDYIDAIQWDVASNAPRSVPVVGAFTVLKYVNQQARLYGLDLEAKRRLGDTAWGRFGLEGTLAWLHAENTATGDGLYNRMPGNARLRLTQRLGAWSNVLEVVGVARKDAVSRVRNELVTPGYGLVNLQLARQWQAWRLQLGVDNLFDRLYALPTGGAYLGQGTTMAINPPAPNPPRWGVQVPGPGRTVYAALSVSF